MNEKQFLLKLRERAIEQEKLMNGVLFPRVFARVSMWLGNHPWRILIPLAFVISIVLHAFFGNVYDETILKIFGGFNFL